ncbi:MAG: hypothetical protein VKP57_09390 [Candidatus Sericytochromatia bacterium]|nr:hypothetical protein [Candidatus Sericytochromatia bacterium]
MMEPGGIESEVPQSLGERLARKPLGFLRLVAGSIAATTMVAMGFLVVIAAGGEGPDVWQVAFPGVLTLWIYAPMLLALLLALLARTRASLLAAIPVAMAGDLTLVVPVLEMTAIQEDAQGGLLILLAPVPALMLSAIVFPLVRAWARRTVPEGRIIR